MSSPCPTPQFPEDQIIYSGKRLFARCLPVIPRPTLDLRVEPPDQFPGTQEATPLLDLLVDLAQECLDVLARRFQEHLVPVATHVLVKKIEAVFTTHDSGFLVGEFETPLLQEVCHERLDFCTQELLR